MDRIEYNRILSSLFHDPPDGFEVLAAPHDDSGDHPETFIDYECAFAAEMLCDHRPELVLDVGSYRQFVLGLLAHYLVDSVDVRPRSVKGKGEMLLVCDAKSIQAEDARYDAVVSLCALEHFGLGRYGDAFDLGADRKAFGEMVRVLKPGGHLIFSTTIGQPCICFNAHRIYSRDHIFSFCDGLVPVRERIYDKDHKLLTDTIPFKALGHWDVYLGCWRKA